MNVTSSAGAVLASIQPLEDWPRTEVGTQCFVFLFCSTVYFLLRTDSDFGVMGMSAGWYQSCVRGHSHNGSSRRQCAVFRWLPVTISSKGHESAILYWNSVGRNLLPRQTAALRAPRRTKNSIIRLFQEI